MRCVLNTIDPKSIFFTARLNWEKFFKPHWCQEKKAKKHTQARYAQIYPDKITNVASILVSTFKSFILYELKKVKWSKLF